MFKVSKTFMMFMMGLVFGLVLLLIITGASHLQQKSAEQIEYQAKLVDATPVKSGVLTEKQRIHSKRFTYYLTARGGTGGGNGISALVARTKRDGHLIVNTWIGVGLGRVRQPESPETFFGELARRSDVVILGRVANKNSQVTEDDGFLFTDYDVAVEEVLKDNAATSASLSPGATITVTWPGGAVLLDGVIVTAIDQNVLPLPTNNHDVVLFLKFLPQTGTYYAARYSDAYEIDGASVLKLTDAALPLNATPNRESFLETLRTVSVK